MGSYSVYKSDARSVADLCVSAVEEAMEGFEGPELRFVGHSLGTQLATHCVGLLHTSRKARSVA